MKSTPFFISLVSACAIVGITDARADEAPLTLKSSGFLEVGASMARLTNGYANRRSEFVRGEFRPQSGERWIAEANHISEFGSSGTLLVAGYEKTLHPDWVLQAGASTSAGGFTLPRLRLDLALGRKWLEQKNLITTVGVTDIHSKDGHHDKAIQFSSAYYFDWLNTPWAVEGGTRYNQSNPGAVSATSYFAAVTTGRDKERVVSLRLGAGREAYQLVDNSAFLADFPSNSLSLTWRQWLSKNYGVQFTLDAYHNPFYDRRGIEASWFSDF